MLARSEIRPRAEELLRFRQKPGASASIMPIVEVWATADNSGNPTWAHAGVGPMQICGSGRTT
jgi:hypothetical protein